MEGSIPLSLLVIIVIKNWRVTSCQLIIDIANIYKKCKGKLFHDQLAVCEV